MNEILQDARVQKLTDIQSLLKHLHEGSSDDMQKYYSNRLQELLESMHTADIAYLLENLALKSRIELWRLVKIEHDADILLEVSDAVRESLIDDMDEYEILEATKELDADEIADLAEDLSENMVKNLVEQLDAQKQDRLKQILAYQVDEVGSLMDFEIVIIRDDVSLEVVLRYLRRLKTLPTQTDKLFVVDNYGVFKGVLPFYKLLLNETDKLVKEVMKTSSITFRAFEKSIYAAEAFERYDLVSAPVLDSDDRLIGRLTIDVMVDLIRETAENQQLNQVGLLEEEDIFASVWKSVSNRWIWLAVNLVTAFCASRIIGVFEESIAQLTALAALMPIVAGIGGNSGNQTITMIVRAFAVGHVKSDKILWLLVKELKVALVNGITWGSVMGLVVWLLYANPNLGILMVAAMTLNLLVAALMGVIIPMTLVHFKKDPAMGSSVIITAITDSGGFFIFLSLAKLFLL